MGKYKDSEYHLHKSIVQYIKLKYPALIFRSDLGGIRLTIGQAVKNKALQIDTPGYPDLFIAKARHGYHGLFLELKADVSEFYTKNGMVRESQHVQDQLRMLHNLMSEGYWAGVACDFDTAIKIINWYLGKEK